MTGIANKSLAIGIALCAALASHAGSMMIGDRSANKVIKIDEFTGRYTGVLASGGGLQSPMGFVYGPDGKLYVASSGTGEIKRYNDNGTFLDNYVSIGAPYGVAFHQRDLICSSELGTVQRLGINSWSHTDGSRQYAAISVRQEALFVAFRSAAGAGIEMLDPATGASLGDLLSPSSDRSNITGFAIGRDGDLYVATGNSNKIEIFGQNGRPNRQMTAPSFLPAVVRFTGSGDILVTSMGSNAIARYSPSRLTFVNNLYSGAGLVQPWNMERLNPTIEGWLILSDLAPSAAMPATVSVEFCNPGSRTSLQSRVCVVRPDGRFDLTTPQFLGEYDMRIKVGSYLRKLVRIDTRDMSRAFAIFEPQNGDADGNDVVDANDYIALERAFGSSTGDANFSATCDLDGDGEVGPNDFTIITRVFAKRGE